MQDDRTVRIPGYRPEALIEALPVGIILTDTAKHCLYVNQRWCQLTGLTADQASGDGWLRALHHEDRERVLKQWETPSSKAKGYADEFRFGTPDGMVKLVSSRVLPLFDERSNFNGYLCAVTDITERQEAEQALRKLAHDLQERVKELSCVFGISRIIEKAGSSLRRILSETAELLARSWEYSDIACARIVIGDLEFQTDNYADSRWKQTADIVMYGEQVGSVEVAYLEEMPERDEGPFMAEERSLIDAVAERLGRTAERLRAEQLVEEQAQGLRERLTHLTRVSVMGEMASSIAHELSQPLTAVATYAQACRRMVDAGITDSSLVRDALERIGDEALRAGDIIHRLRDLVRRRESKRTDCDIDELIRSIENLASVDARLHDVKLRFALESGLPTASVDKVQIQQVVLNLIRNGIDAVEKARPEYREVMVQTSCVDGDILVSVTDYGCGLPEDAEDELFEPFFTTKESGIGMGLSISRSIVISHGGRIWFSRNPQRGTTFFFTIPAPTEDDHGAD